jgi:hypothetical protein
MILEQFSLKGKSDIVAGGGIGLGKGIASAAVQAGAENFRGRDLGRLKF